jgi:hypothetical protein
MYFRQIAMVLVALACQEFSLHANSFSIPGPDNTQIESNLLVVDHSTGQWVPFRTTLEPNDTGFVCNVVAPSGAAFDLTGIFEETSGGVKSKVVWTGAEGLDEGFFMLVMVFPVDVVAKSRIVSGSKEIDVEKHVEGGESLRSSFSDVNSFSFGPLEGRQLNFNFDSPIQVQGIVLGGRDFFHLRLRLTPPGEPVPTAGEVSWNMSWESATEPPIATEP